MRKQLLSGSSEVSTLISDMSNLKEELRNATGQHKEATEKVHKTTTEHS